MPLEVQQPYLLDSLAYTGRIAKPTKLSSCEAG